jgi:Amidohydrolase
MVHTDGLITTIFDADNHYWETSDAFTRHRAPKFADRGVRLVDIDGSGKPRYLLDGGRLHPILPGPGDVFKRPRPGSLYDYFAGKSDKGRLGANCRARIPMLTPSGSTGTPAWRAWMIRASRRREAGVVVAPHAGFEDGYVGVTQAVAEEWGRSATPKGTGDAVEQYASVIGMLMKHRLVRDFAAILVADKLFERNPGVRVAFIENGGTWVGDLLHGLEMLHGQNPGMFSKNPIDLFVEHCWVAPFVEDSVPSLAEHLPVERILFGSDWPHAEGLGSPRDFFKNVEEFSLEDQHKIMRENARHLTLALPSSEHHEQEATCSTTTP